MPSIDKSDIAGILEKKITAQKSKPIMLPLFIIAILAIGFLAITFIPAMIPEQKTINSVILVEETTLYLEPKYPQILPVSKRTMSLEEKCKDGVKQEWENGIDCGGLCKKSC